MNMDRVAELSTNGTLPALHRIKWQHGLNGTTCRSMRAAYSIC